MPPPVSPAVPDLSRTVVVGTSCSGKSTLARRLADQLGQPRIELDALNWLPNWVERDRNEFRALVAEAVAAERWVLDGNYRRVQDLTLARATAIVWLDYTFATVFWRGLRRTIGRALSGEELWSGNRETFTQAFFSRESILWWIIRTHARRHREYAAVFQEPAPSQTRLRFRRPNDADRFLEVASKKRE